MGEFHLDAVSSGCDDSSTTTASSYKTNVAPSGTVNGINTVFTTPEDFVHDGTQDEQVYLRGLRRCEGAGNDYVASESGGVGTGYDTITFATAPKTGDLILIDYHVA